MGDQATTSAPSQASPHARPEIRHRKPHRVGWWENDTTQERGSSLGVKHKKDRLSCDERSSFYGFVMPYFSGWGTGIRTPNERIQRQVVRNTPHSALVYA